MDSNKGLIIGIDLQENISMVSYYDARNNTPANVEFENGALYTDNPKPLSKWQEIINNGVYADVEGLISHIAFVIECAKRAAGQAKIARICFTLEEFDEDILNALHSIMQKLGISENDWSVISHEEAFAYYAYNQRKEIYSKAVLLLDYKKSGIYGYLLMNVRCEGKEIIMENPYMLNSDKLTESYDNVTDIESVEPEITEWLMGIVDEYPVSCIFLTGNGFEVDKLSDEFTKFLCNKRKVFAGQNIYVKGACHCGVEQVYEGKFNQVILACNHRITTGIELDIVERGIAKRLRVVKPGTNWYAAIKNYDFILEDTNRLVMHMKPCTNKTQYEEVIDLSDIPFRQGKVTRVNVSFIWKSHNRFTVVIKDKGFGDFVKSSGRSVMKEIVLMTEG